MWPILEVWRHVSTCITLPITQLRCYEFTPYVYNENYLTDKQHTSCFNPLMTRLLEALSSVGQYCCCWCPGFKVPGHQHHRYSLKPYLCNIRFIKKHLISFYQHTWDLTDWIEKTFKETLHSHKNDPISNIYSFQISRCLGEQEFAYST